MNTVSKEKEMIRKLYKTEIGRWAMALVFTFIIFIIAGIFYERVFFINDDENIMYTLAGYFTNGQPFEHVFLNYVLGGFFRLLYTLAPSMPWYGIYHVLVLYFSIVIINKTILKESWKRDIPLWKGIIVCGVLYGVAFIYPTVLIQFTTTATFAGTSAVVLVLGKDWELDSSFTKIIDGVLSIFLILLCYMHRYNTGYVLFCFLGGTILYQYCKIFSSINSKRHFKQKLRGLSLQVGLICIGLLCVVVISSRKRNTAGWEYFREYDSARFKVTDYPHDTMEQNPALYDSIGWSSELYDLAANGWWFFMDENINANSFKAIAETGYYKERGADLHSILNCAWQLFTEDQIARIILVFIIIIVLYGGSAFYTDPNKKRHIWEYLYIVCMILGVGVLCTYLCYKQRFPLRAFHTITIPFISVTVITLIRLQKGKVLENVQNNLRNIVFKVVLVVLTGIALTINLNVIGTQTEERLEKSLRTLQVEKYAMESPENFYIYDTSLTFRYLPFTVYTEKFPSNLMFWGGMGWNSPAFFKQLEINGLDNLYSDIFLNNNVYYITWDSYVVNGRTMRERFLSYMASKFPGIKIEQKDSIGNNINVYKFTY